MDEQRKYEWEEEKRQKVIKKREVRANNKNKTVKTWNGQEFGQL